MQYIVLSKWVPTRYQVAGINLATFREPEIEKSVPSASHNTLQDAIPQSALLQILECETCNDAEKLQGIRDVISAVQQSV